MIARNSDGSTRLFILGLGAHVLAIGILFGNVLSTSSEAEAPPAKTPAPEAAPAPDETASAVELVPAGTSSADKPTRVALTIRAPADQE